MHDDDYYSPHDGRPTTMQHPRSDILGPIDTGNDQLLEKLRAVHGTPRPDIPPTLAKYALRLRRG